MVDRGPPAGPVRGLAGLGLRRRLAGERLRRRGRPRPGRGDDRRDRRLGRLPQGEARRAHARLGPEPARRPTDGPDPRGPARPAYHRATPIPRVRKRAPHAMSGTTKAVLMILGLLSAILIVAQL